MNFFFIAPLRNIAIEATPGSGVEIARGVTLVSVSSSLADLLPSEFDELMGDIDSRQYRGAHAVVMGHWLAPDFVAHESAEAVITAILLRIQRYLLALWFVRDNSVMCDGGVLLYPGRQGTKTGVGGVKHSLGQYFWNATVEQPIVSFSAADLILAAKLLSKIGDLFDGSAGPIVTNPTIPKGLNRLQRCVYWVENARMCSDVSIKVATYVTCLEVLFSTESAELTHKLAERVSFFLAQAPSERAALYLAVKRAYSVRSQVVHGADLKDKQRKELLDVARTCDELLRSILLRILDCPGISLLFQSSQEQLESYFFDQLMGGGSSPDSK